MGFRSLEETSLLAYIAYRGVEQALQKFFGEGGVCQQCWEIWGMQTLVGGSSCPLETEQESLG
jgi:hypothetical protein